MITDKQTDSDWDALLAFLPEDWEQKAKELGAFTRVRAFSSPEMLLRTLLLHLAQGCSLRETALRARRAKLTSASDVAILKRLQKSEHWLRYLSQGLRPKKEMAALEKFETQFRLCAIDATTISEPGSTGSDWRLHYSLELLTLSCDYFSLTDVKTGETLKNFPMRKNDLIIADRAYDGCPGIHYALGKGAHVLVRLRAANCSLLSATRKKFSLLKELSKMPEDTCSSWNILLKGSGRIAPIPGRICVYRRTAEHLKIAIKKLQRIASRKQQKLSEKSLEAAKYIVLFTTVNEKKLSHYQALDVYRYRWQVELAFKRLKSLTGFGHLPKYDEQSCRAWLYGKLFVGLLAETMSQSDFFP